MKKKIESFRRKVSIGLLTAIVFSMIATTPNIMVKAEDNSARVELEQVELETYASTPMLATANQSANEVVLNALTLSKNRYLAGEAVEADISIDFPQPMQFITLEFVSDKGTFAELHYTDIYDVVNNTYKIEAVFRAFDANTTYTFKGGYAEDYEGNMYPISHPSVSASFYVQDNPDKTGPVFERITPRGDNFQTGEGHEILVRLTDNSKIEYVYLVYETKDKQHQIVFESYSIYDDQDIDKNTYFVYTSTLIFEPGEYHLVEAVAYDEFMNETKLKDLSLSPTINVAQNQDSKGPEVLDIQYDTSEINVGEAIAITVTAKDKTDVVAGTLFFHLFDENGKFIEGVNVDINQFTLNSDGHYEGTGFLFGMEPNTTLDFYEVMTYDSYWNFSFQYFDEFPKVINVSDKVMKSPYMIRYYGRSRESVAIEVAKAHFSDANKVILVNREKYPDAISATNISQGKYPVLYTYQTHLDYSTLEFLQTMDLDEVYVLGGELSVNDNAFYHIGEDLGVKVTRIDGRSRYDANVNAVRTNFSQANHVVIATGEVFSDALYGVSYANTIQAPVVLSKTNHLEDSTVKLLKDLGTKEATIIGGKLSVTENVERQLRGLGIKINRIAGRNRYIGSAEVANASYPTPKEVVVASGEVFSDALVSAPLAQKLNAPILLVRENSLEAEVRKYFEDKAISIENMYIQGGPLTISDRNAKAILDAVSYIE